MMAWFLVVQLIHLPTFDMHVFVQNDPIFESQEQCMAYAIGQAPLVRQTIAQMYEGDPIQFKAGYCASEDAVKDLMDNTRAYKD